MEIAEKGRKPAMKSCAAALRYQGTAGTWRATFDVLQGASKSLLLCPAMPPSTVSGNATNTNSRPTMRMVPSGSAAVEAFMMAGVLRMEKVPSSGPGKKTRLSMMFHTQFCPRSFLYSRAVTKPPTKADTTYSRMAAATMLPRRASEKKPNTASDSSTSVITNRCAPAPTMAVKRDSDTGGRNTSPWISFHPVSSSPASSSSSARM